MPGDFVEDVSIKKLIGHLRPGIYWRVRGDTLQTVTCNEERSLQKLRQVHCDFFDVRPPNSLRIALSILSLFLFDIGLTF
jgi:hypothetical protein